MRSPRLRIKPLVHPVFGHLQADTRFKGTG
jgi:hypothetical protein